VNPGPARGTGGVALSFRDVSKRFRAGERTIVALDKVSAEVHRGTVTGLVGPDAAGKTTLMRLAAGLLVPDAGRILALGFDSAREPLAVQAALGYMPQRFGLYEDLTVQENLDLYADLNAVPASARPTRYDELLHMTGLAGFTGRLAGRLSGGMKQKLGLACVLVHPPELLLLDEPTVGVDPVSRRELWAIVYRLVEERHTTVLLSTAYLDEAERCSDVILIHAGKVLGQGAPADFTRRMHGRTFRVSAPGVAKRAVQRRLERAPGILDAVVQGDRVRVVTEQPRDPDELKADAVFAGSTVTPVAPRFEDAFIALLGGPGASPPSAPADRPLTGQGKGREPVIAVHGLTRRFGDFYAVHNVSFSVQSGEVFGLLGANGAGKSTTFRMLCGLLPASAGTLEVAGVDLRHAAAQARRRIGYMAQKFSLYGDLSVVDNLRFFARSYGLRGKPQRLRVGWALAEFALQAFAGATSRDLPLGYKQRLALAAALLHEPEILFLDEPTSGVDPLGRREFWQRINALAESGVTVLVTTHFMEEAEYCDRLVVMARGQILAEGNSESMKARLRSAENPEPSLEDAFVALITASESTAEAGDAA
jgi:ABC-2 type transport system ATP-binding protein